MGYAADHDDMEQVAQEEDPEESSFAEFVEETTGRSYSALPSSERSNVLWQWRQGWNRRAND